MDTRAFDRLLLAFQNDPEIAACPVRSLAAPALFRTLASADVLHLDSSAMSMGTIGALCAARVLGLPTIVSHIGDQAADDLAGSRFMRTLFSGTTTHVAASSPMCRTLGRLGFHATMIANAVDLGAFAFRERDPLRPRLLSTRNFDPLENVMATIRAFKIVQTQRPDATLTLVGHGSQDPILRALVRELDLHGVGFVGPAAAANLAALHADHDIYLQSANVDNTAAAVLTACASGLPVVAAEAGGVTATLTHGVHALIVSLADYETMGHHVLRLLARPDEARGLARAARARCDAFGWAAVRAQWVDVYRNACISTSGANRPEHAPRPAAPLDRSYPLSAHLARRHLRS